MTARFSPDMTNVLSFSKEEAERLHNDSVSPIHLLLAILRHNDNRAKELLENMLSDLSPLKNELESAAKKKQVVISPTACELNFDLKASRIMHLCVLEARLQKSDVIDTNHVLLAIMKANDNDASNILERMDITYKALAEASRNMQEADSQDRKVNSEYEEDGESLSGMLIMDEDGKSSIKAIKTDASRKKAVAGTPVLDNFGTDMTHAAAEGWLDPVVGREKEIERVAQILCRRKKNNPILIGQPGVGKSAIVEGLAQRIVKHKISRALWNKRIVTLDMANVIAGTKYRGQFEERIKNIISELKKNPDVIVFIDEIHTIVGTGSAAGTMDAANMLKPALSRGEFQCIGATTIDEFRKSIEKDGALERRFQKVLVEPTTSEDTLLILQNLRGQYEEHHHVKYTDEALQACVKLTGRYVTERSFPDKAIDAMDEAGSRIHIQDIPISQEVEALENEIETIKQNRDQAVKQQKFEVAAEFRDILSVKEKELESAKAEWEASLKETCPVVDENAIANIVSLMTGIPVQRIGEEENQKLRNLQHNLQHAVVGQDEAISTLVKAIQRSRIGLKDPKKPIATFMFVGPTGVGKTYLTKKLAEELFGREDCIIRIDMSEYMEKHTVSRMVGAPPGYVGYEEGGQLTEKVRRKPYSIVLLDEIEKAHSDVFNMLLQVMDEGHLTDGNGSTIDFKNTIIIMTSNCGTRQIKDFGHEVGFQTGNSNNRDKSRAREIVKKALQKQFAPEFLNRLDNIIYFDQLDEDSIQKIVNIELAPLLHRVEELGYTLDVTPEVCAFLGKKGYDVQFGARPLKRAIQNYLEDPLCEIILQEPENKALKAVQKEDNIVIE